MKYLFSLFLLPAILSPIQNTWQKFQSTVGKFQIMVPADMQCKEQNIHTPIGNLLYTTYYYQSPDKNADNFYYSVSFVDYPENSIHSDSSDLVQDFFANTIEASTQSVDGKLRYADPIKIKRYPGRLWRGDYNDSTTTIKTRAYLVGKRYYQIQVIMPRHKSTNKAQDLFFNSFRILES